MPIAFDVMVWKISRLCAKSHPYFFWNVVPSVMSNTQKNTATTTATTTKNVTRKRKLRASLNVHKCARWLCVFVYLLTVCDDEPHILSNRINFGIWIECVCSDRFKQNLHLTKYEYSSSHHFYRVSLRRRLCRRISKSARITGSLARWLFTIPFFLLFFSFLPSFVLFGFRYLSIYS